MAIGFHGHRPQYAVGDGCSVVDNGVALLTHQPFLQKRHTGFEFQRGRHPVMYLVFVGFVGHAMCMQIYESGGYDQARGIEFPESCEYRRTDFYNAVSSYGDVAYGVEPRFGIHDTPAFDHEVIGGCLCRSEVCTQHK